MADTPQARNLKYRYGITLDQYEEMLEEQDGVCAICHGNRSRTGKVLAVDHDAEQGMGNPDAVRGLLCTVCNQGIGYFDHDPNLLLQAARYLKSCEVTTKKHLAVVGNV